MKRIFMLALVAPVTLFAAQPALGMERFGEGATASHRGGFAGLQLKLNLGSNGRAVPTARLTMGVTHYSASGNLLQRGNYMPTAELGFSRRGGPEVYVAGLRLSDVQARAGIAPVAAVVAGIAAVGVGVLAVSALDDELNRYQCLLPEKELCGPQ